MQREQNISEESYGSSDDIISKENINYNVLLFRQLNTIQFHLNSESFRLAEASLRTLESLLKPYLPKDYKSTLASMKMRQVARLRMVHALDRENVSKKLDNEFKYEILAFFIECANDKGLLLEREEVEYY